MHVRITVLNGRHRSRGGISESLGLPLVAPTAVIAVAVPLAFRGEVKLGKEVVAGFVFRDRQNGVLVVVDHGVERAAKLVGANFSGYGGQQRFKGFVVWCQNLPA